MDFIILADGLLIKLSNLACSNWRRIRVCHL